MLGCDKDAVLTHLAFDEDTGGDKKIQTALHGVSWYIQNKTAVDSGGLHAARLVKCRIPAAVLGDASLPVPGDTLTCGGLTAAVLDVHDNRGRVNGHIYVEAQG